MGLFDGYARQLAAMPSAPAPQQARPTRGRGLFGGGRRPDDIGIGERLAMIGQVLGGGTESLPELMRNRRQEIEQQRARTAVEDRLRAALSPADTAAGSGTGAMPTVDQQMAALREAQLLNPEVAAQFAPVVQAGRLESMTQGLPLNERLAVILNPERAGQSFATQFEDMTLAKGTQRSRGGQIVAQAPDNVTVNDTIFAVDSNGARPLATAQPGHDDVTARINATNPVAIAPGARFMRPDGTVVGEGAPRIFSAADAVDLVTETGQPIYQNQRDAVPTSMVPTEAQAKDRFNTERMTGAIDTITQLEAAGYDPTLRSVTGFFGDDRARQYQAAALEWADSLLRMTTGAAATRDEIENAVTTYFPQPGDSPQVRAQKAAARERVVASAQTRAAPGNRQVPGQVVTVSTPAEAQALPPGTRYRTPQGQEYIR